jgi:hypothetical protein
MDATSDRRGPGSPPRRSLASKLGLPTASHP